jgi:hypothetical protein
MVELTLQPGNAIAQRIHCAFCALSLRSSTIRLNV